jgi:hypothetical protein
VLALALLAPGAVSAQGLPSAQRMGPSNGAGFSSPGENGPGAAGAASSRGPGLRRFGASGGTGAVNASGASGASGASDPSGRTGGMGGGKGKTPSKKLTAGPPVAVPRGQYDYRYGADGTGIDSASVYGNKGWETPAASYEWGATPR